MNFPTISQYAASVADPHGLFRTLGEPACLRDPYGEPRMYAGGSAVVFPVSAGNGRYALKCYTRESPRAKRTCEYAKAVQSELLPVTRYLRDEIYVYADDGSGEWYDAAISEWIEGETLGEAVAKALHDSDIGRLAELAASFDRAAAELLAAEWAHGDLKPDNIFVLPGGSMKLIDLDAMYFPVFGGTSTCEPGTPLYQHPLRDAHFFNRHIDDYPIALISATLHSLALWPELNGRFGNADILLFAPAEIMEGHSPALGRCMELAARSGEAALYTLLKKLTSPTPHIPGLEALIRYLAYGGGAVPETLSAYTAGGRWGFSVADDGKDDGIYDSKDNRISIPPIFDSALEFSEGLAAVTIGGHPHFIGPDGRCAINCAGHEAIKSFRGGRAPVKRNGQWTTIKLKMES